MKKMNILHFSKQKKAIDLIKEMESVEVEHHRSKLKKLLVERKNKMKELLGHKQIEQPNFNYLRKNHGDFSFIQPNAVREPFISQKIKRRNHTSQRAFSSSPNMKVGNPATSIENQQEIQNKIILNKKFKEYDRIIDEQSGLRKIQALEKTKQKKIYTYSRKRKSDMKRTFFQKMVLDKYNFYNVNEYSSIRSGTLAVSKTDSEMTPYVKILWKPKSFATLESSNCRDYSILSNSSLHKSRMIKEKLADFQLNKRQIGAKSRIKSQGSQLLPITNRKNLNSIND